MTLDEMLKELPIESVRYIERRTKVLIAEEYARLEYVRTREEMIGRISNMPSDAFKPCRFVDQEKSNIAYCSTCGTAHDYKTGETEKCKLGYR